MQVFICIILRATSRASFTWVCFGVPAACSEHWGAGGIPSPSWASAALPATTSSSSLNASKTHQSVPKKKKVQVFFFLSLKQFPERYLVKGGVSRAAGPRWPQHIWGLQSCSHLLRQWLCCLSSCHYSFNQTQTCCSSQGKSSWLGRAWKKPKEQAAFFKRVLSSIFLLWF